MHSNFADRPQSGPYLFRYNFKCAAKRPSMYRVSMTMAAVRPHRFFSKLFIPWKGRGEEGPRGLSVNTDGVAD
jgi:hypothetical protein